MTIGKNEYKITEDMLRVLITDADGDKLVFSKFIDRENITLKDIEEECYKYTDSLREITVIAENPLNGRMMRYNTFTCSWSLIGTLAGYA